MKNRQIDPILADDLDAVLARQRRIQDQISLRDIYRLDSQFSDFLTMILSLFVAVTGLGWSIFVWVLPHP
ncbi:MAG: hypothetical protein WA238_11640 [Methylocella sp.]|jgi:hypothetical protein